MQILAIIGQVVFGLYWINSGVNHFRNIDGMTGYSASKGIPAPRTAVIVTGLLLVLGGLGILTGFHVLWAIAAIVIFLVPTTFIMHAFWKDTDPMTKMSNQINFSKNLALLGAVLMLIELSGIWPWTI